jgi:DnaJ like chaperone protein
MGNFAKWIAGGLGWAFFGPVGGVLGFVLGSFIEPQVSIQRSRAGATTTGDFALSLMVLVAAVMKADGKVLKAELDYVKRYFTQAFGEGVASEAVMMLRDLLKQNIDIKEVTLQMKVRLDYPSKLQMLHFLYGVSMADGQAHPNEVRLIELISGYLGISSKDYESIKAMFVPNTDTAYKILEVEPTVTDEELKKAYRRMAVKYHPDKVAYLGEDFKKTANEKFQKVNEAYEKIKKERGIV